VSTPHSELSSSQRLRVLGSIRKIYAHVEHGTVDKTVEEYQEIANKEQAEEKTAAGNDKAKASKPSRSSNGGGAVRTRKGSTRSTGTFEGVVLPSGSTRTRRPSAKARS